MVIIIYKVVFHKHLILIIQWCIYFYTEEIKIQLRDFPQVTQLAIKWQCGDSNQVCLALPPLLFFCHSTLINVKWISSLSVNRVSKMVLISALSLPSLHLFPLPGFPWDVVPKACD